MSSQIISRTIPITARFNAVNAKELLARDRNRASKFLAAKHPHGPLAFQEAKKHRHHHHHHHHHAQHGLSKMAAGDSIDVTDSGMSLVLALHSVAYSDPGVTYTAAVGVGSPATQYTLLIDTGTFILFSLSFS